MFNITGQKHSDESSYELRPISPSLIPFAFLSMRSKFIGNLIFVLLVNLLVKPAWIFGIDRSVQNLVGPESYGTFFAVFNFSFLFHILLDFGINNFNNREVSREPGFLNSHFSALVSIKVVLSVLYFAVTFLLAWVSGLDGLQMKMLAGLGLNLVLLNFILYLRSNIAARQHFILDGFISVLDRLLAIIFCSYLIWWSPSRESFDLMQFILAQSLALGLTALVAFLSVRFISGPILLSLHFDKIGRLLRESAPYALLGILMTLYYRLDGVMIERLLGSEGDRQAGIYAASYRLFDAANMVPFLFAGLLLPMFSKMLSKGESLAQLSSLSERLLLSLSVWVAAFCFFFAGPLMTLLYKGADPEWSRIFRFLMLSYIPVSMVYVHGTVLLANGELRKLNLITGLGFILNLVLNLFMIPAWGAFGATIATLLTQIVVSSFFYFYAGRVTLAFLPGNTRFTYPAYTLIMVLLAAGLWYAGQAWYLALPVLSVAAILSVLLLRIYSIEELKSLLHRQNQSAE